MNEPVWKKPGWITAIVALISAFLTIPGIVGDYLSRKQDIELAREKTASVNLENQFSIVQQTLAQQGEERIFVLRYMAATLDDTEAKAWAKVEVGRLDDLAKARQDRNRAVRELSVKQGQLDLVSGDNTDLKAEIQKLGIDLEEKNSEVEDLRSKAGLKKQGFELRLEVFLPWDDPALSDVETTTISLYYDYRRYVFSLHSLLTETTCRKTTRCFFQTIVREETHFENLQVWFDFPFRGRIRLQVESGRPDLPMAHFSCAPRRQTGSIAKCFFAGWDINDDLLR